MYSIWEYQLHKGQTDCRSHGQMPEFNDAVRVMLLRRDVLHHEGYGNLRGENQVHEEGLAMLLKSGPSETVIILRVERE